MAVSFLDLEQPIAELEAKIEELRHVTSESEVNIQDEIARLQAKYWDDRMFEIIVSAALGAARKRLFAGLAALEGA